MSSQPPKCPRCGHENVARALFCFQCGRDLNDQSLVEGTPGTGKLVADALRFIQDRGYRLEPGMIARIKEGRMKMPPEDVSGEPLTCLHCGTLNHPNAARCTNCDSVLIAPDEDYNLVARPSARTSIGQVRHNNEDSVHLWAIDGVVIALIADGMGGAAAGEVASSLAVEAVEADFLGAGRESNRLQALPESILAERLERAIQDANQAIYDKTQREPELKTMGTTSTLALVRANRAFFAHVGDSRCYLVNGKTRAIKQVTTDHSFVQALVASGHITQEQARTHPMGSVLYRALGQTTDMDVDMYSEYIHAGDRLVLCSDGLTRHLLADDIARIVTDEAAPHAASLRLIELANERGGEDNVSVIVIKIVDAAGDETLPHKPLF